MNIDDSSHAWSITMDEGGDKDKVLNVPVAQHEIVHEPVVVDDARLEYLQNLNYNLF